MAESRDPKFTLKRSSNEVKRYRKYVKLIPILLILLVLVLVFGYSAASLYMKTGSFTVAVNRVDDLVQNQGVNSLILSDSKDFNYQTARLNAGIDKTLNNIEGSIDIPDWLDNIDGKHNGENYIAYTFYCKNNGSNAFDYSYEVYLTNMTQGLEKAIRIRLYVDGEYTDYAYPRTDGVEGPEPGTTAFATDSIVVKNIIKDFKPDNVTKYTVVIWIEGPDPDCVNSVMGGQLKVDMAMEVVNNN